MSEDALDSNSAPSQIATPEPDAGMLAKIFTAEKPEDGDAPPADETKILAKEFEDDAAVAKPDPPVEEKEPAKPDPAVAAAIRAETRAARARQDYQRHQEQIQSEKAEIGSYVQRFNDAVAGFEKEREAFVQERTEYTRRIEHDPAGIAAEWCKKNNKTAQDFLNAFLAENSAEKLERARIEETVSAKEAALLKKIEESDKRHADLMATLDKRDRDYQTTLARQQNEQLFAEGSKVLLDHVADNIDTYPTLADFTADEIVDMADRAASAVYVDPDNGEQYADPDNPRVPLSVAKAYKIKHGEWPTEDVIAKHLEQRVRDKRAREAQKKPLRSLVRPSQESGSGEVAPARGQKPAAPRKPAATTAPVPNGLSDEERDRRSAAELTKMLVARAAEG